MPDSPRAEFRFTKARIAGVVTTVGDQRIDFATQGEQFGLGDAELGRLKTALGLDKRQIVSGDATTVDLCTQSARDLLAGCNTDPASVQAVILATQTPDHAAPSSAIVLQHRLGLPITSMAFDMRLGCSGFVYGLAVAFSLVESGLERVLLCVGDVASKFVDPADHTIAPIMGDAGSAILIERGDSKSWFQLYSDGSGARALMIPNSGVRAVPEDVGKPTLMHMDGAAVFNFTLQRVPSMISDMLAFASKDMDSIDQFVLHQPNKYILKNLQKRMKIPPEKIQMSTQSVYGNQNAASIPGTISGFLGEAFSSGPLVSLMAGFGIGLSWGACVVETNAIYAPETLIHSGETI